jgi:hypothetical protein
LKDRISSLARSWKALISIPFLSCLSRNPSKNKTPKLLKAIFPHRPTILFARRNISPEFRREVTILELREPLDLGVFDELVPEVKGEEHQELNGIKYRQFGRSETQIGLVDRMVNRYSRQRTLQRHLLQGILLASICRVL